MKSKVKMMCILVVVTFLLMLVSCHRKEDRTLQSKEELFQKVKEMQPELEEVVAYMKELEEEIGENVTITNDENSSFRYYKEYDNITLRKVVEEFSVNGLTRFEELDWRREYTQFDCDKTFANPRVVTWGFYYAENDEPVTWGGSKTAFPLKPEGEGYVAQDASIYYYTEKIVDHWYYFAYD